MIGPATIFAGIDLDTSVFTNTYIGVTYDIITNLSATAQADYNGSLGLLLNVKYKF